MAEDALSCYSDQDYYSLPGLGHRFAVRVKRRVAVHFGHL